MKNFLSGLLGRAFPSHPSLPEVAATSEQPKPARRLVVFTGAGLSADSGISTFRGSTDALWENHSVQDVAHGRTWKANFDLVRRFYNARRAQLATVHPNEAHHMLARLESRYGAILITQNIDDLLERAGCLNVNHVHGRLTEMKCIACGETFDIGYSEWGADERCSCNSRKGVRPNVVFFEEPAPNYRQMWKDFKSLTENDVLLVIGTSGNVIDIGTVAQFTKATTILSNLESQRNEGMPGSEVLQDSQFDIVMHGRAAEMAGKIERVVAGLMG